MSHNKVRSPTGYISEDGDNSMINSPLATSPNHTAHIDDMWR